MLRCSVAAFHSVPLSILSQCGTVGDSGPGGNLTERSLQDAQRLFLMSEVVQPVSVDPLISQDNIRFSKLVVDIVQGRDTLYHVIYIGTGKIWQNAFRSWSPASTVEQSPSFSAISKTTVWNLRWNKALGMCCLHQIIFIFERNRWKSKEVKKGFLI